MSGYPSWVEIRLYKSMAELYPHMAQYLVESICRDVAEWLLRGWTGASTYINRKQFRVIQLFQDMDKEFYEATRLVRTGRNPRHAFIDWDIAEDRIRNFILPELLKTVLPKFNPLED